MKKHSTANILLLELLVVILFFILCVSTLVEVFGAARGKSALARAENAAMLRIGNVESCLRAAEDFEAELARNGFEKTGDGWELKDESYTLRLAAEDEPTKAGILRTFRFTTERPGGVFLFEMPAVQYIPEEVSP